MVTLIESHQILDYFCCSVDTPPIYGIFEIFDRVKTHRHVKMNSAKINGAKTALAMCCPCQRQHSHKSPQIET